MVCRDGQEGGWQLSEPQIRHERVRGDGVNLHVAIAGNGPPVILLHGFPANWYSWHHQIPALVAAGYSVWAPDLRGYNLSDIPVEREAYHLRHLANDVAAIVSATGSPRAHVAGHDWGGIIAWTFAGMHPGLLDRLIILNAPHMQIYLERVWRTSQMFRSWYVSLFQLPTLPEQALAAGNFWLARSIFERTTVRRGVFSEAELDYYVSGLARPGALKAALDYYRENILPGKLALASSSRTDAETLIIWGERDPALGTFLLEGTERFAPHLRIQRIPDVSHWVQNEAPETVNRLMVRFLAEA
jgi:pimeloyl-ACP methyl ester carboxylesterase